jgi:hypothetical protein
MRKAAENCKGRVKVGRIQQLSMPLAPSGNPITIDVSPLNYLNQKRFRRAFDEANYAEHKLPPLESGNGGSLKSVKIRVEENCVVEKTVAKS